MKSLFRLFQVNVALSTVLALALPALGTQFYKQHEGSPQSSASEYPNQHTGYQGQHTGYEGQHTGYQGQQTGYQGQHTGYEGQHTGYEGQHTGYEGQHTGYEGQHTDFQGQQTGYQGQQTGYQGQQTGYQVQHTGYQQVGPVDFAPANLGSYYPDQQWRDDGVNNPHPIHQGPGGLPWTYTVHGHKQRALVNKGYDIGGERSVSDSGDRLQDPDYHGDITSSQNIPRAPVYQGYEISGERPSQVSEGSLQGPDYNRNVMGSQNNPGGKSPDLTARRPIDGRRKKHRNSSRDKKVIPHYHGYANRDQKYSHKDAQFFEKKYLTNDERTSTGHRYLKKRIKQRYDKENNNAAALRKTSKKKSTRIEMIPIRKQKGTHTIQIPMNGKIENIRITKSSLKENDSKSVFRKKVQEVLERARKAKKNSKQSKTFTYDNQALNPINNPTMKPKATVDRLPIYSEDQKISDRTDSNIESEVNSDENPTTKTNKESANPEDLDDFFYLKTKQEQQGSEVFNVIKDGSPENALKPKVLQFDETQYSSDDKTANQDKAVSSNNKSEENAEVINITQTKNAFPTSATPKEWDVSILTTYKPAPSSSPILSKAKPTQKPSYSQNIEANSPISFYPYNSKDDTTNTSPAPANPEECEDFADEPSENSHLSTSDILTEDKTEQKLIKTYDSSKAIPTNKPFYPSHSKTEDDEKSNAWNSKPHRYPLKPKQNPRFDKPVSQWTPDTERGYETYTESKYTPTPASSKEQTTVSVSNPDNVVDSSTIPNHKQTSSKTTTTTAVYDDNDDSNPKSSGESKIQTDDSVELPSYENSPVDASSQLNPGISTEDNTEQKLIKTNDSSKAKPTKKPLYSSYSKTEDIKKSSTWKLTPKPHRYPLKPKQNPRFDKPVSQWTPDTERGYETYTESKYTPTPASSKEQTTVSVSNPDNVVDSSTIPNHKKTSSKTTTTTAVYDDNDDSNPKSSGESKIQTDDSVELPSYENSPVDASSQLNPGISTEDNTEQKLIKTNDSSKAKPTKKPLYSSYSKTEDIKKSSTWKLTPKPHRYPLKPKQNPRFDKPVSQWTPDTERGYETYTESKYTPTPASSKEQTTVSVSNPDNVVDSSTIPNHKKTSSKTTTTTAVYDDNDDSNPKSSGESKIQTEDSVELPYYENSPVDASSQLNPGIYTEDNTEQKLIKTNDSSKAKPTKKPFYSSYSKTEDIKKSSTWKLTPKPHRYPLKPKQNPRFDKPVSQWTPDTERDYETYTESKYTPTPASSKEQITVSVSNPDNVVDSSTIPNHKKTSSKTTTTTAVYDDNDDSNPKSSGESKIQTEDSVELPYYENSPVDASSQLNPGISTEDNTEQKIIKTNDSSKAKPTKKPLYSSYSKTEDIKKSSTWKLTPKPHRYPLKLKKNPRFDKPVSQWTPDTERDYKTYTESKYTPTPASSKEQTTVSVSNPDNVVDSSTIPNHKKTSSKTTTTTAVYDDNDDSNPKSSGESKIQTEDSVELPSYENSPVDASSQLNLDSSSEDNGKQNKIYNKKLKLKYYPSKVNDYDGEGISETEKDLPSCEDGQFETISEPSLAFVPHKPKRTHKPSYPSEDKIGYAPTPAIFKPSYSSKEEDDDDDENKYRNTEAKGNLPSNKDGQAPATEAPNFLIRRSTTEKATTEKTTEPARTITYKIVDGVKCMCGIEINEEEAKRGDLDEKTIPNTETDVKNDYEFESDESSWTEQENQESWYSAEVTKSDKTQNISQDGPAPNPKPKRLWNFLKG